MGCGVSGNEVEVNEPKQAYVSEPQIKELSDSNGRFLSDRKVPDLKQIKTEKSIMKDNNIGPAMKEEEEADTEISPATKIFLFGESAGERKIIEFSALPSPTIQILLSRNNNPTPTKYQPTDVILEESQELCSSFMYNSFSHPPYNYMFATYISSNTIFLCGGANYNFDHVSNEAFFFKINTENHHMATPSKSRVKNERRIGNNLMGSKFDRLSFMKNKRYSHMGVFLKVGKLGYIYVMGGRTQNDQVLKSCERYSLQENKWSEIAQMNYPRSTGFAMIVNNKIYAFGGYTSDSKRSKKIERYNPAFDAWEVLNIQLHKGIQTGLLLPCPQKNDILIVGGNVEFGSLKSVIRVNFQSETYCWDSDLKKERLLQKGLSLLDQNVAYVFGGDFEDTVEKYSYKDKTWKNVTNLSYANCISPDDINAFTMAQQTISISFEVDGNSPANQAEPHNEVPGDLRYIIGSDDYPCIYELNTAKWVLKKRNVPMSLRLRSYMTSTLIKPGKIFIGGGIDSYMEKASRSAYIYYPGTNKAIEIAKMKQKKFEFAACASGNFIYIFGGRVNKDSDTLATCEKYDINEDKWVQLPEMPRERAQARALLTSDQKKILIVGGTSFMQTISEIDILDIETDTFSTLKNILPLPLQIRSSFIYASTRTMSPPERIKTEQQFEFLDEQPPAEPKKEQKESISQIEKKEQRKEDEKIQQGEGGVQEIYDLLIFNYNSYLKQYNAVSLTVQLDSDQQVRDNKAGMKLNPFNIAFEVGKEEEKKYFFISSKGVFKWSPSSSEILPQIVINQIHLLQMPLDRFALV